MLTLSFTFYLFCHLINFLPDVVAVVVVVLWSDLHTPKWGAILRWTPLVVVVVIVAVVVLLLFLSCPRPAVVFAIRSRLRQSVNGTVSAPLLLCSW